MPDPDRETNAFLEEAERRLAGMDPRPFSPQAFQALTVRISAYVRSLTVEAAKIAGRHRADVISAAHVQEANDYLVTNSSRRWFKHLGTVGGILLGAALSNFLSMTTSDHYGAVGVATSALLAITGAFGVALHIGKD